MVEKKEGKEKIRVFLAVALIKVDSIRKYTQFYRFAKSSH